MPEVLSQLIYAAVVFLVTQGLKALSALLGRDLSGYAALITALAIATVMAFSEALFGALPPEWQEAVRQGAEFIAALLMAMGVHYTLTRSVPNAFARHMAQG